MNPFSASGTFDERQEISYSISSSEVIDYWSVSASGSSNLQSGDMIGVSSTIGYRDECFGLNITMSRSYSRDREIEPSDAIMVNLFFKYLGTFTQNQALAQ